MKKLLGIVVLGLLLSGNAYARIIKLDCNPIGLGVYAQTNYNSEFFKITIDTKLKKLNYYSKVDGKIYNDYMRVISMDDQFIIYENPEHKYKGRLDYINFIEKDLNLKKYGAWDMRCAHLPDSEIAEKPKKQKPKSSPDDDKIVPAGSGSGFFVSKDGHAITNYHVIEGCDINKLSFKGSQTEVKVLAVDKVNDIAILKSNAKPDVIFPVSNEDVSLLEDVIVAGFPLGERLSSAIKTNKGVVTSLAGAGDNYSFFQTDAAINSGNSGGPIVNQKGNVVGIAVATWVEEGVQGVHFGIKSSTLKTFASANGLNFASPNYRDLSNKDLGKLVTRGTVYLECHMTVAKIKKRISQAENRKAFFKEHK